MKSIGQIVCNGLEINGNVHHVHVVMNHNPQEESVAINFAGLSSHLTFFYDPPLGPFSKVAYFNSYILIGIMSIRIFVYVLSCVLWFTDDSWDMLCNSLNQRLVIGAFEFNKKGLSTYTKANNSRDVVAALHLMLLLLLKDFLYSGELLQVSNSQRKVLKLSSHPVVDGQSTNHNSFEWVKKKISRSVIDFLSVQLVFNNWYPFSTQFAPSPFAKQVPKSVMQALKRNHLILINICICLNKNANSLFVDQGVKGWPVSILKQLFSMAVTFTNKFKKGIISSWDNYQANKVSICCFILHPSQN
jgi:hypothetical protein